MEHPDRPLPVLTRYNQIVDILSDYGIDTEDPRYDADIAEFLYVIGKRDFPNFPWDHIYNIDKLDISEEFEERARNKRYYRFLLAPEAVQDFERIQIQTVYNLNDPNDADARSKSYFSDYMFKWYDMGHVLARAHEDEIKKILAQYPNMLRDNSKVFAHVVEEGVNWLFETVYDEDGKIIQDLLEKSIDDFKSFIRLLKKYGMTFEKSNIMDILQYSLENSISEDRVHITKSLIAVILWAIAEGIPVTNKLMATLFVHKIDELFDSIDFNFETDKNGNIVHELARHENMTVGLWEKFREKLGARLGVERINEMFHEKAPASGRSPIMDANMLESFLFLLEQNVNLAEIDRRGHTLFYLISTSQQSQFMDALLDWIDKKHFKESERFTMPEWRKVLNRIGRDLNITKRPGGRRGNRVTNILATNISESENEEERNIWKRALYMAILFGAPSDRTKIEESCGQHYEECHSEVKKAYALRKKIETAYLNRPFGQLTDPLYQLSVQNKDAAKLARARLREKELCDKLQTTYNAPELLALANYIGADVRSWWTKKHLCFAISKHLSQGGAREIDDTHKFILAIESADFSEMLALLKKGVDINRADSEGYLPLYSAIVERDPMVIKFLLDRGADPLKQGRDGTPAAVFGFYKSAMNTPKDGADIEKSLRAAVKSNQLAKLQHEIFLGQTADLLTAPSLTVDSVRDELEEFREFGVQFSPKDMVYGKTLEEWVDDEEYGGEKPETFPREDLKELLQTYFFSL